VLASRMIVKRRKEGRIRKVGTREKESREIYVAMGSRDEIAEEEEREEEKREWMR
jgi:hypothetical protein